MIQETAATVSRIARSTDNLLRHHSDLIAIALFPLNWTKYWLTQQLGIDLSQTLTPSDGASISHRAIHGDAANWEC